MAQLSVAASITLGCISKTNAFEHVSVRKISEERFFNISIPDALRSPMFDTLGYSLHNSVDIIWPAMINDSVPLVLHRAILKAALSDSTSPTIDEALENFLSSGSGLQQNQIFNLRRTTREQANRGEFMQAVKVTMERNNGKICVFKVFRDSNEPGTAHGMYSTAFINYDLQERRIIDIDDLFYNRRELTLMLFSLRREQVARAHCIDAMPAFESFPLTNQFSIGDGFIDFVYNPYEIASYAEGTITLRLHLDEFERSSMLTPYGKKLLEKTVP